MQITANPYRSRQIHDHHCDHLATSYPPQLASPFRLVPTERRALRVAGYRPGCKPVGRISKSVPFVLATERDSNSATCFAAITYGIRKREYCYEEGSFRGADIRSSNSTDPLVYAKRPGKSRLRRLSISRLCQRFCDSGGDSDALSFVRARAPKRPGCFRQTGKRRSNSLALCLTGAFWLTARRNAADWTQRHAG